MCVCVLLWPRGVPGLAGKSSATTVTSDPRDDIPTNLLLPSEENAKMRR